MRCLSVPSPSEHGEMDTLPTGLVGALRGAKMEGRGCPVGAPKGVKTEGTPSNAAGTLRGDAPVFHPKASRREMEKLPNGLVGTPGGVKTEGRGARTKTLEPVATHDGEGGEATDRGRRAASPSLEVDSKVTRASQAGGPHLQEAQRPRTVLGCCELRFTRSYHPKMSANTALPH